MNTVHRNPHNWKLYGEIVPYMHPTSCPNNSAMAFGHNHISAVVAVGLVLFCAVSSVDIMFDGCIILIMIYILMATTTYYIGHGNIWQYLYKIALNWRQGTSEGFDGCDRPSDFVNGLYDFERWNWMEDLENNHPETLKLDRNRQFFDPCDLQIWQMILKNYRAPLPCP